MGIMVNRAMVTPKKSKRVPIILANTNSYNVWIWQPLLAANVVEVESCPWDYQTILSHDGKDVSVSFCPVPTLEVQEEIFSASTSATPTGEMNLSNQAKDQGRNQNLFLNLNLIVCILIFRRNWIDFLSHSIWGK